MTEKRPSAVGAILPYFGSKRTAAGQIVAEFGPHDDFKEPACGSLAIILRKAVSRLEIANDLNGDVTCLAWTLQDDQLAPRLYDRISRTLFSQNIFRGALAYLKTHEAPDGPDLEFSTQYLVASWCGMNGAAGQKNPSATLSVRWTSKGGDPATRWRSVAESIPDWHERLRRVTITRMDLFDMLPKCPDQDGAVIYCDPPYLTEGRAYKCSFKPEDHGRLAEELNRFKKTRVVLSYYADARLADLYDGWWIRPLKVNRNMANPNKPGGQTAPEVLILNGPSVVTDAGKLVAGNPVGQLF